MKRLKNGIISKKCFKFRLMLHKAYFEKGYALTSYIKYAIALFGISSLNVKATMIIGIIYAFLCYFLGWGWFYYNFIEEEIEVGNAFNRFVKEMRRERKI